MNVLGIDIGGTGIKGAPVDLAQGKLTAERHRIPTPQPATPAAVAATVNELVKHFQWSGPIGCGLPAVVQQGVVRTASNIDQAWIGTNAAGLFREVTNCDVKVVNDADAAGLAEVKHGAGKDEQGTILMVTIGTGLGTAMFNKGHLLPNTEFGHIPLKGGPAEKYAADSIRKKEELSWKKWAKRFNKYLLLMEKLTWPDMIIVGGGASKKHEKFFPLLTVKAKVVPAQLLNEAGIVGAAQAGV